MFKVIFLGAGASKYAGYPLCSEILIEIVRDAKNSRITNREYDAECLDKFKLDNPQILPLNPNIEIVFTEIEKLANKEGDFNSIAAKKALNSIVKMIEFSFGYKNHLYESLKAEGKLNYLKSMLANVNVVISVNWDNLPEFILNDESRWYPPDGYGLNIPLDQVVKFRYKVEPSQVKVLKLHGSIGWRKGSEDKFYLRYYDFLKLLPNTPYFIENTPPHILITQLHMN